MASETHSDQRAAPEQINTRDCVHPRGRRKAVRRSWIMALNRSVAAIADGANRDSAPAWWRGVDHAAFASSDTRSQVVAFMLGRASIRASHATRFWCGAPSSDHSGVAVKKATAGAR